MLNWSTVRICCQFGEWVHWLQLQQSSTTEELDIFVRTEHNHILSQLIIIILTDDAAGFFLPILCVRRRAGYLFLWPRGRGNLLFYPSSITFVLQINDKLFKWHYDSLLKCTVFNTSDMLISDIIYYVWWNQCTFDTLSIFYHVLLILMLLSYSVSLWIASF